MTDNTRYFVTELSAIMFCNPFFLVCTVQGSVISPSDEDSQTFSVNAANGEIYKLRGKC